MRTKLIETWFPVKEISRDSGIEMAYKSAPAYIKHAKEIGISENLRRDFYDPKIRSLHPWFARRPCSASRAITLAAILDSTVDYKVFLDAIGWNMKDKAYYENKYPPLLFYTDPKKNLIKNLIREKEIDEIFVCDPMAGGGAIPLESLRLGFQTIAVDYNPVAYIILKATIEFPAKYGEELANRVKNEANKLISYIQENLGEYYPEEVDGYIFARGINCPYCGGLIPIIQDSEISSSFYLSFYFDKQKKIFNPSLSNLKTDFIHIEKGDINCPYCKFKFKKNDAYKLWTEKHMKILDDLAKGKINEDEILSTHIILIRQTKTGYKLACEKDYEAFLIACQKYANLFNDLKQYLPIHEIPEENEVFNPVKRYGIKYWYQLFNPRQLLSIGFLIRYINNRILTMSNDDYIGKISMLYLGLGVSRVVDYNSILTTWKKGTIRDTLGQYARNRKISYGESYCEAIVPRKNLQWIFETEVKKKTQGGIIPILYELCKRLQGLGNKIEVLHGDARKLTSYISKKFDLINVDPPYFDTHIYSDISEYFWQVIKLSVNQLIKEGYLFSDNKGVNWQPQSQIVPREGELIVRRGKFSSKADNKFDELWYANEMLNFFKEAYKALNDDGVLIVWFTHRSLNAWKSIISALYGSNFYITKIWPVTTELLTRLVAKNNNVLDKTLIIVARKKLEIKIDMKEHAKKLAEGLANALKEIGTSNNELKIFLLAAIMSSITVEPLENNPINHCYLKLIPKSLKIAEEIIPKILGQFDKEKPLHKGERNGKDSA